MYVKHKQKVIIGVSLLVIACLLVSGMYVYFEYYTTKKETPLQQTHFTVDDRISPLEKQGVVLEVLRIRHRGMLEKLMKPGSSWKDTPSFYYITNMDGLEYISKNVQQHGRMTEVTFTTWDTICQENKIMRNAEEEQKTSTVTLTIMERVDSGLFGRKTTDVESDTLTVTYDYRTGRWSGDDKFKDYDGYGHYLGETFEIWFNIYQLDYDGDFIPYWTEVNILGTDPTVDDSKLDPDSDGIPTAWEWKWGYDPFTWDDHQRLDPDLDGIENIDEYKMADWFADPFVQDMYVEVDTMGRGGLFDPPHVFFEGTKQATIERFSEHNIQIFFDNGWPGGPINGGGQVLPHVDRISQESGMVLQFYKHYFPDERKGTFVYFIVGHGGGFQHPAVNNVYDVVQITYPFNGLKPIKRIYEFVAKGIVPNERGFSLALAGLLLHELAHCCGVSAESCDFEGIDNMSTGAFLFPNRQYKQTWGQYKSVLNYLYANSGKIVDLSHGENGPPYDQNDWEMMFVGYFQYNSKHLEESTPEPPPPSELPIDVVEWVVTGYTYDANLTEQFVKHIGDYSPIDPIKVNWSVYKLVDKENYPNYRDIKIFAQPKIKTTKQWVLNQEADLDSEGNLQFYSFDDILKEKTK